MDDTPRSRTDNPPRVLLADDHLLLLEAFAKLLEEECEVVGMVGDGEAVLAEARRLHPEIVVLDISMPRLDGLEAGRRLRAAMPDIKIIYLTVSDDPDLRTEALRIGASGYLLKHAAATELFDAIQMAADGETYVTPSAPKARGDDEPGGRALALTDRQRDVLRLITAGLTMKEIARELSITPRTVAFHKYRMMQDLGLPTTAQLVAFALRHGLGSE